MSSLNTGMFYPIAHERKETSVLHIIQARTIALNLFCLVLALLGLSLFLRGLSQLFNHPEKYALLLFSGLLLFIIGGMIFILNQLY